MNATTLPPFLAGFADPVHDAQACFRAVLDAMAQPGRVLTLDATPAAPDGVDPATAALCLTLLDNETTAWLDTAAERAPIPNFLSFRCGVALTLHRRDAAFALVLDPFSMPRLSSFNPGSDAMPEDGATLIIQVTRLEEATGFTLTGPGIESARRLAIDGLPDWFMSDRAQIARLYPRGVDAIFCCGERLAALPRTTVMEG